MKLNRKIKLIIMFLFLSIITQSNSRSKYLNIEIIRNLNKNTFNFYFDNDY